MLPSKRERERETFSQKKPVFGLARFARVFMLSHLHPSIKKFAKFIIAKEACVYVVVKLFRIVEPRFSSLFFSFFPVLFYPSLLPSLTSLGAILWHRDGNAIFKYCCRTKKGSSKRVGESSLLSPQTQLTFREGRTHRSVCPRWQWRKEEEEDCLLSKLSPKKERESILFPSGGRRNGPSISAWNIADQK